MINIRFFFQIHIEHVYTKFTKYTGLLFQCQFRSEIRLIRGQNKSKPLISYVIFLNTVLNQIHCIADLQPYEIGFESAHFDFQKLRIRPLNLAIQRSSCTLSRRKSIPHSIILVGTSIFTYKAFTLRFCKQNKETTNYPQKKLYTYA